MSQRAPDQQVEDQQNRFLPAVELRGITKRFPGILANDHVDLAVWPGEVHCLLGENGAGKSTLMSILSGMLHPDAGHILVGGKTVTVDSPRRALELGIGTVYQHSALVPALTVLENLMLGDSRGLRLDTVGAQRRLDELSTLLGVEIEPHAVTGALALGQQQQVEIMKALWRGSRILILDEPTSMLTPQGVADLQRALRRLKRQEIGVIFITHKLHEALAIGDRISILRQGRLVRTLDTPTLRSHSHTELQAMIVDLMFGEEAQEVAQVAELQDEVQEVAQVTKLRDGAESGTVRRSATSEPVLELIDVSALGDDQSDRIDDVSLAVRPGQILGIAGVDGNGQRALAEAIAGQRRLTGGEIRLGGRSIGRLSVSARQRLGLRYVSDDRLGEGIVTSLSVAVNLVLKRIGQPPYWRRGVMQRGKVDALARQLVASFDVRTPGVKARAGTLSGGNLQKVLLARELSFDPTVVVYHKPTQGLDIKTTQAVRQLISEQADAGVAAIVISPDLDEILEICDHIAVLYRGRIAGAVENRAGASERIGRLMLGGPAQVGCAEAGLD